MRSKRQVPIFVLGERPGRLSRAQIRALERKVLIALSAVALIGFAGTAYLVTRPWPGSQPEPATRAAIPE